MSTQITKIDSGRRPCRWTAAQVECMIEAGVFADEDVELLGGVLYRMVKTEVHHFAAAQAADALRRLVPEDFHVREQKSLRHGQRGLPEPDAVVAESRPGALRPQPPSTSDVPLIIEVCDHTQRADYQDRYRRYASAGVPESWGVDLHDRRVVVFRSPRGRGRSASYAESVSYAETAVIPVTLVGHLPEELPVADLLPPATRQE